MFIQNLLVQTRLGNIQGLGAFQPNPAAPGDAPAQIVNLITSVYTFLTILAGLSFILYFVLGAIKWISSAGDAQKVTSAREQMTAAAIGLIAVIASYAVVGIVGLFLGIDLLDPEAVFCRAFNC